MSMYHNLSCFAFQSPYNEDPEGQQQVRDFEHCLQLMNALLTVPPKWSQKAEDVGLIGCPFNAVLDCKFCAVSRLETIERKIK
jgi:phosphatidylserine decarboxylase